jgi:hypothetical protein
MRSTGCGPPNAAHRVRTISNESEIRKQDPGKYRRTGPMIIQESIEAVVSMSIPDQVLLID